MSCVAAVAAIIKKDGKILAAQRGCGDLAGGWEFPGGKIEFGETPEDAVVREISEELRIRVRPERRVCVVKNDNGETLLTLYCFLCAWESGELTLTEHRAIRWVDATDIDEVAWLPADVKVVAEVKAAGIV